MKVVSLLMEVGHMLNQIAVTLPTRGENEPFTMATNLQTMLEGIRTDALEEIIRGLMIGVRDTDSDLAADARKEARQQATTEVVAAQPGNYPGS